MIGFLNANIKEWRCLFNLLGLFIQQSQKRDSKSLKLDESLDWQFIYETAQAHRVLPFLMVALKENGNFERVPGKMRSQAIAFLQQAEWQNQVKMIEFNRIQRMFESQRIPIIPLKGIALTNLVYKEHPFRTMEDIDILIRKNDLEKVKNLMVEHGFQWVELVNRWHASLIRELIGRGDMFNGDVALDLQWSSQFIINSQFCSLEWDQVWRRRIPCGELGDHVFLLHPNDQISYLSLQILSDMEANAPRLIQLLDLALVLKKYDVSCKKAAEAVVSHVNYFSTEKVRMLFSSLDEYFFEPRPLKRFSESSRRFLELFLAAFHRNPLSFKIPINSVAASPWRRLVFVVSYFFPNRRYLKMDASTSAWQVITAYFNYWKSLAGRLSATIKEKGYFLGIVGKMYSRGKSAKKHWFKGQLKK